MRKGMQQWRSQRPQQSEDAEGYRAAEHPTATCGGCALLNHPLNHQIDARFDFGNVFFVEDCDFEDCAFYQRVKHIVYGFDWHFFELAAFLAFDDYHAQKVADSDYAAVDPLFGTYAGFLQVNQVN